MTRIANRSHWAMVPEWVILSDALSDRAVRAYALLRRYGDDSGRSYHSRKGLAETLRCSTASLDRALGELVAVGALTIESWHREDGSQGPNNYMVEHDPLASRVTPPGLTGEEGGLSTGEEGGSAPTRSQQREPDNESHSNEKESLFEDAPVAQQTDPAPGLFDAFWDAFEPKVRRVGKGDARKAWATAIKNEDPAAILAGQARYNDEIRGSDPRYRKTPGPWLRAERWLDEPGANRDRRARPAGAGAGAIIGRDHFGPAGVVAPEDL